jgi:hypothetical protein
LKAVSSSIEKVASGYIAFWRVGLEAASEELFAEGWALHDLLEDDPSLAWEAIKVVVTHYTEEDLFSVGRTEAQVVVGQLAAGPIEDLLSERGAEFISDIEQEARKDRRFRWALGGVWQSTTPDHIWARVEKFAEHSYWERPSSK